MRIYDYDIVDTQEELSILPELSPLINKINNAIIETYSNSNNAAIKNQDIHQAITILASSVGAIAVLIAIVHLSGIYRFPWPMWLEDVAALLAFFAVLLGLIRNPQKGWLLERHKAERCRLVKFRYLIHPALWCGNGGELEWMTKLSREMDIIKSLSLKSLHDWIRDVGEEIPNNVNSCTEAKKNFEDMLSYYKTKRIEVQAKYFNKKIAKYKRLDSYIRVIPPTLFFGSVGAVLLHFILEIISHGKSSHEVSTFLVIIALSLPVIGAGFRTYRSAFELSRSVSLFEAKRLSLERLKSSLEERQDVGAMLFCLWRCEQLFEEEHREWLRIMIETEWYG